MKNQSELSNLYPSVSGRTDNMSYRYITAKSIKPDNITAFSTIMVSILLTIPLGLYLVLINFLAQTYIESGLAVLLPVTVLSFLLWTVLLIVCVSKISKYLTNSCVSNGLFTIVYALCVLPVLQYLYDSRFILGGSIIDTMPLLSLLFTVNLIFVFFIFGLINTRNISENVKTVILLSAVLLCVGAVFVNMK